MSTEVSEVSKEIVIKNKLLKIFNDTINNPDWEYDEKIEDVNHYNLFCKALSDDKKNFKMLGSIMSMFNYQYQDCKSVLMLFSIHNASNETSTKNISEKVMDIARNLENTFVTLDYLSPIEVKEEKYIYILAVKKI
jgi:hypothetical protein